MKTEFTPEDLKKIASQLSCPTGDNGIEMGNLMNETNIEMTRSSIELVLLKENDSILELGHGNCSHLGEILEHIKSGSYTGLEISETMHKQAKRKNLKHISLRKATFLLYDGTKIPFKDAQFDKIITTNTLYFWQKPVTLLNELYRVLKPNGRCCIAYAQQEFMENLPFVDDIFELYTNEKVSDLVSNTSFRNISFTNRTDKVKNKLGVFVDRKYSVVTLEK